MSTEENKVFKFLHNWDNVNASKRKKILEDFIQRNINSTSHQLQTDLCHLGSLFLARICIWLNINISTSQSQQELLRAIKIFVDASSGTSFLEEMNELGIINSLVELIRRDNVPDKDKLMCLMVLTSLSQFGLEQKILICRNSGIKSITSCMIETKCSETQLQGKKILEILSEDNEEFSDQIYQGFIMVMSNAKTINAQHLATQSLIKIHKSRINVNKGLLDRIITMLETSNVDVKISIIELICQLFRTKCDACNSLVNYLINLLKPMIDLNFDVTNEKENLSLIYDKVNEVHEPDESQAYDPKFIQQAASARCIRSLCLEDVKVAEKFISANIYPYLIYAMGNIFHNESQRQASMTLDVLCQVDKNLENNLREYLGNDEFSKFKNDPVNYYLRIAPIQAEMMLNNNLF